jgi:hypothetical protein
LYLVDSVSRLPKKLIKVIVAVSAYVFGVSTEDTVGRKGVDAGL